MLKALQSGSVQGYSVLPPVLTTWKLGNGRDSDIDDLQEIQEKGLFMKGSRNLRQSAREEMARRFRSNQTPLTNWTQR